MNNHITTPNNPRLHYNYENNNDLNFITPAPSSKRYQNQGARYHPYGSSVRNHLEQQLQGHHGSFRGGDHISAFAATGSHTQPQQIFHRQGPTPPITFPEFQQGVNGGSMNPASFPQPQQQNPTPAYSNYYNYNNSRGYSQQHHLIHDNYNYRSELPTRGNFQNYNSNDMYHQYQQHHEGYISEPPSSASELFAPTDSCYARPRGSGSDIYESRWQTAGNHQRRGFSINVGHRQSMGSSSDYTGNQQQAGSGTTCEEDYSDNTDKLIAFARFNRNTNLMKTILSETMMPDPRSIVSTSRLDVLKEQVRALEEHLVLQQEELKKEENTWLKRKEKFAESTKMFENKYKQFLRPATTMKTYTEFFVKYYHVFKQEAQKRNQWEQTLAWAQETAATGPSAVPTTNTNTPKASHRSTLAEILGISPSTVSTASASATTGISTTVGNFNKVVQQ